MVGAHSIRWIVPVVALSSFSAAAAPLVPPVYRGGIDLAPNGNAFSRNVTVWKGNAYVSADSFDCAGPTLFAVDVSDPSDPAFVGSSGNGGCKANASLAFEDRLYLASWSTLFRAFDLGPAGPTEIGSFDTPQTFGWSVDLFRDRAYVSHGNETSSELWILDVSDPSNPGVLSTLAADERLMGAAAVRGSYAFYTNDHHFEVANVSDAENPSIVVDREFPHRLSGVRLRGDLAFVWWEDLADPAWGGFHVLDVSDPLEPVEVGGWSGDTARDFALLGDLAFVATVGNGVVVVDVSDPSAPVAIAQPNAPGYDVGIAAHDRFLYVGTGIGNAEGGQLHVYQVLDADPDDAGPGRWREFEPAEASWDLQFLGGTLPTDAGWSLSEGSNAWASVTGDGLRVNDTGTAPGSKVKWERRWDATHTDGVTVLARARCDAYDLGSGAIENLGNLFLEDGRFAEEFALLSDRVRALRAGIEAPIDGDRWHTYRIVTEGSTFRLFVDESPSPLLAGPLSSPTDRARLRFGSGSSASTQSITFAFVFADSTGPHPPPPVLDDPTPDVRVRLSDLAGKGSMSGLDPATARVEWTNDGGDTWISSDDRPVTVAFEGLDDRGTIAAHDLSFEPSPPTGNRVRFSMRDRNGNVGVSPEYIVRLEAPDGGGAGDDDDDDGSGADDPDGGGDGDAGERRGGCRVGAARDGSVPLGAVLAALALLLARRFAAGAERTPR